MLALGVSPLLGPSWNGQQAVSHNHSGPRSKQASTSLQRHLQGSRSLQAWPSQSCLEPGASSPCPRVPQKVGRFEARAAAAEASTKQAPPMASTAPPILTREEVLARLHCRPPHPKVGTFKAFYSSLVGGITRDYAAMVLPIDDHMAHRGHAVFDTAIIMQGQVYELEEHLDRFMRSASAARIKHEAQFPRETIRGIIMATASASGLKDGLLRYWLSVGPGGFTISTLECPSPVFYCMAIGEKLNMELSPGVKMITAKTPMKSPDMSTTKTVNYLPNALVHMEAEEAGVYEALWVDDKGFVGEGPSMNVAFVSEDNVLLVPSFERILAGCTMKKVLKLAEKLVDSTASANGTANGTVNGTVNGSGTVNGTVHGNGTARKGLLRGIRFAPVSAAEARRAREMMLVGSGTQVKPVLEWDGIAVGNGEAGPVAAALHGLLMEDYRTSCLSPIPDLY